MRADVGRVRQRRDVVNDFRVATALDPNDLSTLVSAACPRRFNALSGLAPGVASADNPRGTCTRIDRLIYPSVRDTLGPRFTRDGRVAFFSRRVTESDVWIARLSD
jgi:hypothetical protein